MTEKEAYRRMNETMVEWNTALIAWQSKFKAVLEAYGPMKSAEARFQVIQAKKMAKKVKL